MPSLPIDNVLPALLSELEREPFAILVAPPGAGKTTRVPLALLDAPWRQHGRIIVLEPRRLAARAAARRMASVLGEEVGATVGFRVRMESKVSSRTRIEVVTEGVFTRMILADPELTGIAAVLFDEFHERNLDGDLGLAFALDAAALRPDLRLIVMSATIDGAKVAQLMNGAPVIESSGRAFPVETRHLDRDPLRRIEEQTAEAILAALRTDPGSVLAFLAGQAEIRRTADGLSGRVPADTDVVPLHGQLSFAEQDRAIAPAPPGRRKVVLATSIAETSITIEDVRIVVDSLYRRAPAYDPSTGLTALVTRRVSRAGADQRRGRAGRTAPGICYRLWSDGQTGGLDAFDAPEILEADLAGFALDLAAWGITDPSALRFLDPPPATAFAEAVALLKRLDAVDGSGRITEEGRALAALPLHPRLAHMVHRAAAEGESDRAAALAVVLGERGLGGDDVDLDDRLAHFQQERGPRAREARALARRWATLAGSRARVVAQRAEHRAGWHLARAYPDRIAQQAAGRGRFRLANGRAASVDETDALSGAAFLAVAEVTGTPANGRIRSAARLDRAAIETLFGDLIETDIVMTFDPASRSVRARRQTRLGALRLDDAPAVIADHGRAAQLLAAGAATTGIGSLPWTRAQLSLRERATYLNRVIGAPWPDLSDEALEANGAAWLVPHIVGCTEFTAIGGLELDGALASLLPVPLRAEIDRLLPSHFVVPSGSRLPIDYAAENGPSLEVRVQELFGLDSHPSVAHGKVPLLLILLSPARRPIQTTRDLPGFWRGSWRDVAKDLRGRYPRHPWPDDPLAAQATSRAKPRGT